MSEFIPKGVSCPFNENGGCTAAGEPTQVKVVDGERLCTAVLRKNDGRLPLSNEIRFKEVNCSGCPKTVYPEPVVRMKGA